jgi:hypothetical protein
MDGGCQQPRGNVNKTRGRDAIVGGVYERQAVVIVMAIGSSTVMASIVLVLIGW